MDKRLVLPVVIMLASVLMVSGMINFQANSAQDTPDADNSGPVIEDPETVAQKASSTPTTKTESTASNNSSSMSPASTPTMMYYGGGGFSSASAEDEKEEPAKQKIVTADFSVDVDCLTATFTDMSENANSWEWDFGDGTNSTLQNPGHIYAVNGSYTVSLVASALDGSNASTEQLVEVKDCSSCEPEDETPEDEEQYPATQEVPEFPTVAIPMVAIIGLAFFFGRKQ